MRLKVFRAPTVAAAMAQVRSELGEEALILSTRRSGAGVEVTAALERPAPHAAPDRAPDPALGGGVTLLPDPARLAALRWHGVPEPLATTLAGGSLEAGLAGALRFGAVDLDAGAPPLLLAGPPGGGKSLTVAKLATRLVLAGRPPLVISADAQRAGAAEQLAAFTRLLGIPLLVATDALTLARAMARRLDGAPVLIDTAAINPFDPAEQAATATLATAACATTALVLPAGLDPAEAADAAAAFRAAGATHLVATRLDVVRRMGSVLAAGTAGLRLAEAGTGPGAADGLVPLSPDLLAGRLAAQTRKAAA